jgi:hypothetical protein
MSFQKYFPSVVWLFRTFTGHWARRVYVGMLLLLVCLPLEVRLHNAYRARKFQAVLAGLERVKVDQTSEAELVGLVPHLRRTDPWKDKNGSVETWYGVELSNEFDWATNWVNRLLPSAPLDYSRSVEIAGVLGTRFLSFGAGVLVRDGKVAKVQYGINNVNGWPRAVGLTLSVKNVHGPWRPYRRGFSVSSIEDENLQFRIARGGNIFAENENATSMAVEWTSDAAPELISHAHHLDLSCAWGLHGCLNARDIAPALWQDAEETEAAMQERLKSCDPCPDRILADRVRYLPDLDILLLEVVGFQEEDTNAEGEILPEFNTNYKVIEVIRGAKNYPEMMRLRYRHTALTTEGGARVILRNPMSPLHKPGGSSVVLHQSSFRIMPTRSRHTFGVVSGAYNGRRTQTPRG